MRAIGLIVTAGLVLTACTGSPGESEASPSSADDPTPVVSASPSPTVPPKPERPEAMNREDAEGAAAAAKYFIELYPYVMATGDVEEFKAMSHRACGFCEELTTQALAIRDQGEIFVGGETSVQITKEYRRDEVTGIYPFDSKITQEAQTITAPDGSVVLDADREVLERRIEMGRRAGEWVMVTVAPIPEHNG